MLAGYVMTMLMCAQLCNNRPSSLDQCDIELSVAQTMTKWIDDGAVEEFIGSSGVAQLGNWPHLHGCHWKLVDIVVFVPSHG